MKSTEEVEVVRVQHEVLFVIHIKCMSTQKLYHDLKKKKKDSTQIFLFKPPSSTSTPSLTTSQLIPALSCVLELLKVLPGIPERGGSPVEAERERKVSSSVCVSVCLVLPSASREGSLPGLELI